MNLFSSDQIRMWDNYTIANEPVASIDLMERAATRCYEWIIHNGYGNKHLHFFCGKGNNGGDGLAIARLCFQAGIKISVYILGAKGSDDFDINKKKLEILSVNLSLVNHENEFPEIPGDDIIVDALFGTGLNRPLEGFAAKLVNYLNKSGSIKISIDVPSGMFTDSSSVSNTVLKADHTLTFMLPKVAFLLPENSSQVGEWHLLDIGLHNDFYQQENTLFDLIDLSLVKKRYKPRNKFSHKGNFGHAAIIAGSKGMMGAAVLASRACLRSGAGKLTTYIPEAGYEIMQVSVSEAMAKVSGGSDKLEEFNPVAEHEAIGIGPGIGSHQTNEKLLNDVFTRTKNPMVIDADALSLLSQYSDLFSIIPKRSVLTPHPKEFERLFGKTPNDFDRLQLAITKARELNLFIILKGHYTFIATPGDKHYYNSTGNAGMATGGSGDVLTGILTGLLAQNYDPLAACILGVYLHGLAGDYAAQQYSQEAMIAGDIIEKLGQAFKKLQ